MADITPRGVDCNECGERGERGERGKRGHDGPTGATGPTGPAGSGVASGALLKFSGVVAPSDGATPVVSYLADFGVGLGLGSVISLPVSYPVAVAHDLVNMATNLVDGIALPPGTTLVFDLLQNNVPVPGFSITYVFGELGVKAITAGPVAFAIGDTFDLQVTATGVFEAPIDVSVTVGVA
jgi:hypothetical protein